MMLLYPLFVLALSVIHTTKHTHINLHRPRRAMPFDFLLYAHLIPSIHWGPLNNIKYNVLNVLILYATE